MHVCMYVRTYVQTYVRTYRTDVRVRTYVVSEISGPARNSNRRRPPAGPIHNRFSPPLPPEPSGLGCTSYPSVNRISGKEAPCTLIRFIPARFLYQRFAPFLTPALLQPQPFRHSRSRPSLVAPPLARLTLTPKGTSLPKHLLETLGVELAGSSARGGRGEGQKSLTGEREGKWPHLFLSSPPWQKGDEGPFDP